MARLAKSPEPSHTKKLAQISIDIMKKQGIQVFKISGDICHDGPPIVTSFCDRDRLAVCAFGRDV